MKLYDMERSGNAYKLRLLLALLGKPVQLQPVDLAKAENREPWFLALNPRGQVPVLDDDGHIVWDSLGILVYLARKYGGERWLPTDAEGMAEVMQWLAVMENEIQYGLSRARAILLFARKFNLEEAQALGRRGLDALEARLSDRDWLALDRLTIADIGCFPYVALAPEGQVSLQPYPGVQAWVARIKVLPGFIPMPGL